MFHHGNFETPEQRRKRKEAEEEAFLVQLGVKMRTVRNRLYERYAHQPEKLKKAQEKLAKILQEPYNFL